MTHFLVNQTRTLVQESSPPREGGPTPAQKEGLIFIGCGAPWGVPGGAEVKNLPASARAAGDVGSVPGRGRCPGGGNGDPFQYFCLDNPMDREPGGLQSTGSQSVRHNRATEHVSTWCPTALTIDSFRCEQVPYRPGRWDFETWGKVRWWLWGKVSSPWKETPHKKTLFFPWVLSCLNVVPGNSVAILETKIKD